MSYKNVKKHRLSVRQEVINAHGGKCVLCGYDRCTRSLHFHHINPEEKSFTLSQYTRISSRQKVYNESKKCILVCSNCHGEIHEGIVDITGVYSSARLEQLPDTQKIVGSNPTAPTCVNCGNKVSAKRHKMCKACYDSDKYHTSWPDIEILINLVEENGYVAVGKMLNVSDNAVRKRIRNHS